MSSILEALRELERDRPGLRKPHTVSVADGPRDEPRTVGLFYPLSGGLAIGVLAVALYMWGSGEVVLPPDVVAVDPSADVTPTDPRKQYDSSWLDTADRPQARVTRPAPPPPAAPAPARASAAAAAPVPVARAPVRAASVPASRPPTRAPVPAASVPASPPPARAPARAAVVPASPPPTRAPAPAASVPASPSPARAPVRAVPTAGTNGLAEQVVVESVRWSPAPEHRTVTLRIDGRRLRLHQRDSVAGIEVQLVMKDGVYLKRGGEVYFAAPKP